MRRLDSHLSRGRIQLDGASEHVVIARPDFTANSSRGRAGNHAIRALFEPYETALSRDSSDVMIASCPCTRMSRVLEHCKSCSQSFTWNLFFRGYCERKVRNSYQHEPTRVGVNSPGCCPSSEVANISRLGKSDPSFSDKHIRVYYGWNANSQKHECEKGRVSLLRRYPGSLLWLDCRLFRHCVATTGTAGLTSARPHPTFANATSLRSTARTISRHLHHSILTTHSSAALRQRINRVNLVKMISYTAVELRTRSSGRMTYECLGG
ncbi:hypothetical protein IG631_05634 [Alternaria alternata]|nr:hypothetical protein IG631_05634 [Alternaria alternata]